VLRVPAALWSGGGPAFIPPDKSQPLCLELQDDDMNHAVAHQFESIEQQREAATLGMWIFLATEVLFFGGLFAAYTVYRTLAPEVFHHASHHLDLVMGGLNTGVLLGSSLTMALAVHGIQLGKRQAVVWFLVGTALLGIVFLGVKAFEYHHKFAEHLVPGPVFTYPGADRRQAEMFFVLYFLMTGLHALHVLIGIVVIGVLALLVWREKVTPEKYMPVEITGLYWHFVDIVWVFLFPLLYLAGARG
jgi:cytochrome c oxidase subunit III